MLFEKSALNPQSLTSSSLTYLTCQSHPPPRCLRVTYLRTIFFFCSKSHHFLLDFVFLYSINTFSFVIRKNKLLHVCLFFANLHHHMWNPFSVRRVCYKRLLHPVAYFLQNLTPAERNYGVGDKEILAIVASLTQYRPYVVNLIRSLMVITDHSNMTAFASKQILNRRQAR
jgi:hypothetical protein